MLERRRKPRPEAVEVDHDDGADAEETLRESSEAARHDASSRAAELLARLRKM